jgi:hypothetical protein
MEKPEPGQIPASYFDTDDFVDLTTQEFQSPDMSIKVGFEVKVHENRRFNELIAAWKSTASSKSREQQDAVITKPRFQIISPDLSDRMKTLSKNNEQVLKEIPRANLGSGNLGAWPVKVVLEQQEFLDLETSSLDISANISGLSDSEDSFEETTQEQTQSETVSLLAPSKPPRKVDELVAGTTVPQTSLQQTQLDTLQQQNKLLQSELQRQKEAQQTERNRLETMLITLKLDLMTLMNEIRSSGAGYVLDRLQGRVSFIP